MNRTTLCALTVGLAALTACKSQEEAPKPAAQTSPAAAKKAEPKKAEAKKAAPAKAAEPAEMLKDPSKATLTAPDKFAVKLETTKGDIIIDIERAWAPQGADRIFNLVKAGFFQDVAFFRVIGGFMAQGGIHGDPNLAAVWRKARIKDDPVVQSNTRGMVTFATAGPNTRTTQFFINFGNNSRLDGMGFAPFGKVRDMKIVDALHAGYGEGAPRGRGPNQGLIQQQGNEYLKKAFPELDYIKSASIL